MRELVKDLLMKSAREQRASNAAKLAADSMRVGRVSYVRSGMSVNEYWERGAAWDELQLRREQLDKVWCREGYMPVCCARRGQMGLLLRACARELAWGPDEIARRKRRRLRRTARPFKSAVK